MQTKDSPIFSSLKAYALLALLMVACLLGVHIYLALTPANSFLNWFHFDDAFYYFKTAQNIVAGYGPTFDGTGPTNGFHPLWMILLLPVFAVARGDLFLPLRLVLVLVGLLLGSTIVLFYREGRYHFGAVAALLVVGVWLLHPPFYIEVVAGGIESTISVLTLVGFWAAFAAMERTQRETDPRAVAVVGVAAAFAMLARLDNALLVAVAGLFLLYRWWCARVGWKAMARLSLAFGLPGFVGVGGFLLWSRLVVGTWLPVSAQVKAWWGGFYNIPYGRALRYQLIDFLAAFWGEPFSRWPAIWQQYHSVWTRSIAPVLPKLVGIALGYVVAYGVWRKFPRLWKQARTAALDVFLVGASFHFIYLHVLSGMTPLRDWYWTSEKVALALLAAFALGLVGQWGTRWLPPGEKTKMWGVAAVAVVTVFLGWKQVQWAYRDYPLHNEHLHLYLHQARWVEAHTNPSDVVGSTGAGSLGYFTHRTVLALDGLIGTPAYFEAWKSGHGVQFLAAHHLRYVMGGGWIKEMDPYQQVFADHLELVATYDYGYKTNFYRFVP